MMVRVVLREPWGEIPQGHSPTKGTVKMTDVRVRKLPNSEDFRPNLVQVTLIS